MAVLAAAQLLDELMGRNRNVAPNEKVKDLNWEDTEYCKYFMVKFCPHDLFVNTRADLGPCSKTHDEEVRKMFLEAKKSHQRKIQYMEDFLRFSMSMINEVDRKIVKGKQRLALSNKNIPTNAPPGQIEKNQEKINILNERINDLEKEAEEAGTDGNVEQAQGLMKLCDQLKEEREELRKQVDNVHWNATAQLAVDQEKQMEVCEVCGAFLIVGDAQQRIDDHLMGKQHTGYMRLKKAVEEVQELVKEARDIRDGRKPSERDEERRKEREKRREKEKDKNKEKERDDRHKDKEEHRDKEKREKERERDRDRDKRRTEDRERDKSKDKERDRESHHHGDGDSKSRDRERHRERDRERDRDRRHRDGSRHHHHHRHRH